MIRALDFTQKDIGKEQATALFDELLVILAAGYLLLDQAKQAAGLLEAAAFAPDSDAPANTEGEIEARLVALIDEELRPACLRILGILEFLVEQ